MLEQTRMIYANGSPVGLVSKSRLQLFKFVVLRIIRAAHQEIGEAMA